MAQTREDKIYLAYTATKASLQKEGLDDKLHGRTLLYLAEVFKVSPLVIQQIVSERRGK